MVITFITEQGGIGKTSLCFNLGWHLASIGKKVLLVDTDAQNGNLSYVAGVPNKNEKSGVNEILSEDEGIKESIIRLSPNLSIIPANNNAMFIADTIKENNLTVDCLKKEIDKIKNQYDYIFIDTNPTPSIIHVICLVASDNIIIPLTTDAKSIEGTEGIIDTYYNIKHNYNKNLEVLALVYNKYDKRTNLGKVVQAKITELCREKGLPIALTKITNNIAIAETVLAKEGITTYNPDSAGSNAYKLLSKELFGI